MIERRTAERIAKEFHETYERLAPSYSYETRRASAVSWEDVPLANKELMIQVVWELLDRGVIAPSTVRLK
jgi:hypothetical protein